jgi:hypothetical protein
MCRMIFPCKSESRLASSFSRRLQETQPFGAVEFWIFWNHRHTADSVADYLSHLVASLYEIVIACFFQVDPEFSSTVT